VSAQETVFRRAGPLIAADLEAFVVRMTRDVID